jgi:hypothetical protein
MGLSSRMKQGETKEEEYTVKAPFFCKFKVQEVRN